MFPQLSSIPEMFSQLPSKHSDPPMIVRVAAQGLESPTDGRWEIRRREPKEKKERN